MKRRQGNYQGLPRFTVQAKNTEKIFELLVLVHSVPIGEQQNDKG
jgi:hypothetical protein